MAVYRPLVGLCIAILLLVMWPTIQSAAIQSLMKSSIGFGGRSRFLAQEVNRRFPKATVSFAGEIPVLYSCNDPTMSIVKWMAQFYDEKKKSFDNRWMCTNDDLELKGVYSSWGGMMFPTEADGDDRLEVMEFRFSGIPNQISTLWKWSTTVVVRLNSPTANEIVGIVDIDREFYGANRILALPQWKDTDSDGTLELLIVEYQRDKTGNYSKPVGISAEFGWSEPGGILLPRFISEDGTIKYWSLPGGKSIPFASDELIDDVVERVIDTECDE